MVAMRAKVRISSITKVDGADGKTSSESLKFHGVAKDGPYPPDGSDEDNTFAKFSPSLEIGLTVTNPALLDKFSVGDKFYLNFEKIEG